MRKRWVYILVLLAVLAGPLAGASGEAQTVYDTVSDGSAQVVVLCTLPEKSGLAAAARLVLKPLLLRYLGTSSSVVTSYTLGVENDWKEVRFNDSRSNHVLSEPLSTERDVESVCSLLLINTAVTEAHLAEAWRAVCARIAEESKKAPLPLDVYVLCETQPAVASDGTDYVLDALKSLLDTGNTTINMIGLSAGAASEPGMPTADALRSYLLAEGQSPGRVRSASVDAESLNGEDYAAAIGAVCGAFGATLYERGSAASADADGGYSFPYSYDGALGGVLFVVRGAVETAQVLADMPEPGPGADVGAAPTGGETERSESAVAETTGEKPPVEVGCQTVTAGNVSWLRPQAMVDGEYTLLVTVKDSIEPTVDAYRIPGDVRLSARLDGAELSGSEATVCNRGWNAFSLATDAAGFLSGDWTVNVYINGIQAAAQVCTAVGDALSVPVPVVVSGSATLQFVLQAASPGLARPVSPVYSLLVKNRLPSATGAEGTRFCPFDDPSGTDESTAAGTVTVDLGAMFSDPDGDALQYSILSGGTSLQRVQAEGYVAAVDGTALTYTPVPGGENGTDTLTLQADDGYGGSVTDGLSFERFSIRKALEGMAFSITVDGVPSSNGENAWSVSPKKPVPVRLQWGDASTLAQLRQAFPEADPASLFDATVTATVVEPNAGTTEAVTFPMTVASEKASAADAAPSALMADATLPGRTGEATCTLAFSVDFRGKPLEKLSVSAKVRVENTAPQPVGFAAGTGGASAEAHTVELETEIKGKPGEREPLSLAALLKGVAPVETVGGVPMLNVAALFTDAETPDALTYTVTVSGAVPYATETLPTNAESPATAPEETTREYDLPSAAGDSLFDLSLADTGTLTVSVSASDGALASTDSWRFTVVVSSAYTRFLRTALLAAAGFLALCLLTLLILWLRKPRFRNAYVSFSTDEYEASTAALCLDPGGRRSVPLYPLLVTLQVPPIRGLDADVLGGIRLKPERRGILKIHVGRKTAGKVKIEGQTLRNLRVASPGGFAVSPSAGGAGRLVLWVGNTAEERGARKKGR